MKLDLNYNALVLKARRCLQTMDVVQAARICEDLVKQRKNDPAVLSIMSRIAIEQSRNDEAVKLLERCLALQPKAIEHTS
jgi:predicted Zn-dependent protease